MADTAPRRTIERHHLRLSEGESELAFVPHIEKLTALHPWTVVGVRAGDLLDCLAAAADAAAAARTELSSMRDILIDYREFGTVAELRAEAERLRHDRDDARRERDEAGLRWGEHYNAALAAAEAERDEARTQLAASHAATEATEVAACESAIEYGAMTDVGWVPEYRGIKYARQQRTIFFSVSVPVEIDHWTYADHRHPVEGCTFCADQVLRGEQPRTTQAAVSAALSAAPQPEPETASDFCGTKRGAFRNWPHIEPPASDEPARCTCGEATFPAQCSCAMCGCDDGPAASGTPDGGR